MAAYQIDKLANRLAVILCKVVMVGEVLCVRHRTRPEQLFQLWTFEEQAVHHRLANHRWALGDVDLAPQRAHQMNLCGCQRNQSRGSAATDRLLDELKKFSRKR